ncbi:MAG: AraC family transcriptional regulator [Clostridiales bacterium]|nr:AraC family transcriptional regulator [Clostridiales bacterium]
MEKNTPDFREKTSHGDALLPVSYHHCHIPEHFRTLSLHWHEEMEISYIEEGSALYTINFEPVQVNQGDLIFISPHALHGADEWQGYSMSSQSLVFHLDFLGCMVPDICTVKYLNPLLTGKRRFTPVIHPGHPGYAQMKGCFLKACRIFQEEAAFYELRLKALLMDLLADLYAYGCVENTNREDGSLHAEEQLKEILTYIQEHYAESLSIHELAAVCHFSDTHFMNFFRKYTGTTCIEYLNRYRLAKAASALEETDSPVMDIALENGFRNISYFNKLFKNQFGITPREYRKAAR